MSERHARCGRSWASAPEQDVVDSASFAQRRRSDRRSACRTSRDCARRASVGCARRGARPPRDDCRIALVRSTSPSMPAGFRLELLELLDAAASQPGASRVAAVRIARLADVAGDELDLLVVVDANDGLLPRDDMHDALVSETLADAIGRASRGAFIAPTVGVCERSRAQRAGRGGGRRASRRPRILARGRRPARRLRHRRSSTRSSAPASPWTQRSRVQRVHPAWT